jgi:UDP-3-O-[3-hydroxymyristoyl] glucosamine N-acyltransferase
MCNKEKRNRNKFIFNIKNLNSIKRYNNMIFKDIQISDVSTIKNPKNNSLIFSKEWSKEIENKLVNINHSLILIKKFDGKINSKVIEGNECLLVGNPRLEYAIILNYILSMQPKKDRHYKELNNRIIIGENVNIGKETTIEPFVFIDHDVRIGNNCILKAGVRICSNVLIGNNTIIGQNSVIGGPGFGIEKNINGKLIRIPQIGGVVIGNNIEIDALSTIDSGTIEPTIIEDNVMIDDHVHIAHNDIIKKGCIITGGSVIGGSVTIGKNSWLGSNCSIKNGITIGKEVLVGVGAVIRKSTKDDVIVAGKAAKQFTKPIDY